MRAIPGDLIALARGGAFDVIAHGCNCFHAMGAGIAAAIATAFPAAYEADRATPHGDRAKLGTCSEALVRGDAGAPLVVVNAYTQFAFGGGRVHVEYDAVAGCLRWIRARHAGARIGLPKIGAGLAGGDWSRIAAIIDAELAGEDATVVEFAARR